MCYKLQTMKPSIEINRLSLIIDKTQLSIQQSAKVLILGELPVLEIPFKVGLVDINWRVKEGDHMPDRINLVTVGELTDPDWKVRTRMDVFIGMEWNDDVSQLGGSPPFVLQDIHLGEESHFYIDNQEVNLTPTINRVLIGKNEFLLKTGRTQLMQGLKKMSHDLLGSDLILDLITDLFYQITGDFRADQGSILLSAAYDRDHFMKVDEAPPYLFLKIPTTDLEYFMNHFKWPPIEVKGYELVLKSIEVVGPNRLIINMSEITKNWDIVLNLKLELRDNSIYPVVEDIQANGLDLLKKTLFNILKGLLIKQVEKKPISFAQIYEGFKADFEKKYPFIQIQPGFSPFMDTIEVDKISTELMVHFIQEDPNLLG